MTQKSSSAGQQGLSVTFVVLAVTFCVCLITSNLFVPRLWRVGNTWMQLSGAVVIFPISYIINDLLTEVYGYRKAMKVIWMGFAMSAFVALAAGLVSILPAPIDPENQAFLSHSVKSEDKGAMPPHFPLLTPSLTLLQLLFVGLFG